MEYGSSDFQNLKAIEILKLSLLSARVMYGKIHHNRDSKPNWSSNEAAQWKRTFIWLAYRLWWLHPFRDLSPDELAALQQLARSGWREIPDPTEDSSQQVLPLPDYFYFMLWRTAGEDLSQIPSRHPQLLQITHMSSDEQHDIVTKGWNMAWAYIKNPGNLYPPGTEDDEVQGIRTSSQLQGPQDPTTNDPGVGVDELAVSRGSQTELPTDNSVSFMLSIVLKNSHDSLCILPTGSIIFRICSPLRSRSQKHRSNRPISPDQSRTSPRQPAWTNTIFHVSLVVWEQRKVYLTYLV